ncbi:MAG: response regulator [Proteobacteria bacterium]|nr:response regulator [Pseudomonadota bacterium]MBU1739785.1 response regulator [Pseudomonadota bacterium]
MQRLRVLVVDDDTSLREAVSMMLDDCEMFAHMAENGRQAVQMLQVSQFDLLISDVRMPEMDGFQLLRWVREHRPSMEVIMMSGDDSHTTLLQLMRADADDFLLKPFTADELSDAVERCRQRVNQQQHVRQLPPNLIKQSMHDVHGGLSSVEGITRLLLKKYHQTLDESGRDLLLSVISQVRKLIDHSEEYATQAQAIDQRGHLEDNLLDLQSDVINPVLATLAFEKSRKNIDISNLTQADRRLPIIIGNQVLVKSVVRNLFDNAIKYSPRHGRIDYRIVSAGPFYQVVVENETVSFSAVHDDKQSKIIDSAKRQNHAHSHAGLGLGLNMADFFACRCGGEVRDESTTDGARFIFSLPVPAIRKPDRRSYRIPTGNRMHPGYGLS